MWRFGCTGALTLGSWWHRSVFSFLVLANLQPRKGVVETVTAFVAAFGPNNSSVFLRVHAKWGDAEIIKTMDSFKQFHNVELTIGVMNETAKTALWREADCVVALSKGEGFGLIPREALSLGIPVIVSDLPAWADLRQQAAVAGADSLAHFVRIVGREKAAYAFTSEDTGHFMTFDEDHAQEVAHALSVVCVCVLGGVGRCMAHGCVLGPDPRCLC